MPAASPAGQKCFGELSDKTSVYVPNGCNLKNVDKADNKTKAAEEEIAKYIRN